MRRAGAGALLVMADPILANQGSQLIALAAQNELPTIYDQYDLVVAGGLMSYGASLRDAYRLLGTYAGKILRGIKPADRPGGNVTGIVSLGSELDSKRLELLRALLPAATHIAVLLSARDPRSMPRVQAIQALSRALGISVNPRLVNELGEFAAAYAASAANRDEAILVQESPLTFENQQPLVALAAQHRLPAIYERRQFVDNGGLVSYGQLWRENIERAAVLVDKVLKGAKPADPPIEQPTHFELVVNLKTARALGLTIPQSLLARSDEVIE